MGKLSFKIFQIFNDSGVKLSFTDGKGRERSTYFGSPPSSIDHVGLEYLQGRFANVKTARHDEFIKSEYKRLIAIGNFPSEYESDFTIKSLLHNTIDVATPTQRIQMAKWLGLNIEND